MTGNENLFAGSIPQVYERYMVPLFFKPYAVDLASRVAQRQPSRVLEIAAGTGVVTRQLARALPAGVRIVATDLNQPMLDHAAALDTARPVEWQQADAMQLPFPNASFDAVVCQFGAMFFPDKPRAYSEARRVLSPSGAFIFNVWDRLEHNEFAETVHQTLATLYLDDPPQFIARVPHGYHDPARIAEDVAQAGFARAPEFTIMTTQSRADSPRAPAIALCQGTPMRNDLETRSPGRLGEITDRATAAIAERFGTEAVEGKIQAYIVVVER